MAKKRKRLPLADNSSLGSSLGDAFQSKGFTLTNSPPQPPAPTNSTTNFQLASLKQLVLRRERKGRAGKTVTVVSGFPTEGSTSNELKQVASQIRKALGCGATVESNTIVLQGDQGAKAAEYFRVAGVKKVIES